MSVAPDLHGRAALVAQTREVLERLVAAEVDDALAGELAEQMATLAAALPTPNRATPWFWDLGPEHRDGSSGWWRDNPTVPPLSLRWDGTHVHGTAQLGVRFTGPPGRVHGGYVAALLDHTLGALLSHAAVPSMTVSLDIRYRAATPIGEPITTLAGIGSTDGRKTHAWAEVRHGGHTTARAEGFFLATPGSTHEPDNPRSPGGDA